MNKLSTLWHALSHGATAAISLLAVGLGFIWLIVTAPEVAAAMVVVGGGLVQLNHQKKRDGQLQVEEELRQRKSPVYKSFIDFWIEFLMQGKLGKRRMDQADLYKFFTKFSGDLMVWGSDSVVRKYVDFRTHSQALNSDDNRASSVNVLYMFEEVMLAMRADLGHANSGLQEGDLLRLFVNDLSKPQDRLESATSSGPDVQKSAA